MAPYLLGRYHLVLTFITLLPWVNSTTKNNELRTVQKHISALVHRTLRELDGLQVLDYNEPCASVSEEKERHALNDLVAQVIHSPKEDLLAKITSMHQKMLQGAKSMCNYSRGLACDDTSHSCSCYTGDRHGDIYYEPLRENGTCKLDEMSRCYSPGYLVSRGASVIPCISGAKCVGEVSGRRCVSPLMNENCYCQRPCPDGSFSNVNEELRKCIARLEEISVLDYGNNCSFVDQQERDDVVASMEQMERAGPIIRAIKRLLATQHFLCSPQEQLVCNSESLTCICGPDKELFVYERFNDTCVWSKGSRCFPQELYSNITGSNGTCIQGTECILQGTILPCNPAVEEPFCFCQDPVELESNGAALTSLMIIAIIAILVGGILGYLIYAKKISCPGSSPANV